MGHSARTSIRSALRTPLILGLLAATPGCTGGTADPAPHTSTPADVCTSLVSYWAKEAVEGSSWAGLDWEQKGLSNEQLGIHDEVLADARATERTEGRAAALAEIDRESRRRCEAAHGATGSSENWRPPGSPAASPAGTGGPDPAPGSPAHPPSLPSPS
ncbi:hypothetical protein [Streptomyces sp. NBC_01216]|uniref:hypothetical protein n=1 Tax=unclassified Streptomyces TaxID=2593676 RepID=UPI002E16039F|nr:hypothetical protein OG393_25325 [Streptomyces sp. NBC_01216]